MKLWFKVLLPTVLACALCALFASPAFAFTGSAWLLPPTRSYCPRREPGGTPPCWQGSSVKSVDGWDQVTCTGTPYQIGFQNGYSRGGELRSVHLVLLPGHQPAHLDPGTPYAAGSTFTKGATALSNECKAGVAMWPLIPYEYQQELMGIADGEAAWFADEGLTCPDNLWDVVINNAWSDKSTYSTGGTITANTADPSATVVTTKDPNGLVSGMSVTIAGSNSTPSINGSLRGHRHRLHPLQHPGGCHHRRHGGHLHNRDTAAVPHHPAAPWKPVPPVSKALQAAEKNVKDTAPPKDALNRCSSFVATGPDWTTDGLPVIGHTTWSNWNGQFEYNYMYYVHPQYGYDYCVDTCGGSIWSGQDYYANSSGLIMTETTLSDSAKQPGGIPIFVRACEVAQYCLHLRSSRVLRHRR